MCCEILDNQLSVQDFLRLAESAGWRRLTENQVEAGIRNSLLTVAAVCKGEVIGMGRVVGDGYTACYIQDVVVLPEYQNMGIGKAIMESIIHFIKGNGIPDTYIATGLFAAEGREGFYNQFGFITRPNADRGAGMTMRLKVDSDIT